MSSVWLLSTRLELVHSVNHQSQGSPNRLMVSFFHKRDFQFESFFLYTNGLFSNVKTNSTNTIHFLFAVITKMFLGHLANLKLQQSTANRLPSPGHLLSLMVAVPFEGTSLKRRRLPQQNGLKLSRILSQRQH